MKWKIQVILSEAFKEHAVKKKKKESAQPAMKS